MTCFRKAMLKLEKIQKSEKVEDHTETSCNRPLASAISALDFQTPRTRIEFTLKNNNRNRQVNKASEVR
jgi:hypothetical protein